MSDSIPITSVIEHIDVSVTDLFEKHDRIAPNVWIGARKLAAPDVDVETNEPSLLATVVSAIPAVIPYIANTVFHSWPSFKPAPAPTPSASAALVEQHAKVVIKCVPKYDMAMNEVEMLKTLAGHPNIAKLLEYFRHSVPAPSVGMSEVHLVLPKYSSDIHTLLSGTNRLRNAVRAHGSIIISGIASALQYCHRNSIFHRDVKLENVVLSRDLNRVWHLPDCDQELDHAVRAILIDFGLATTELRPIANVGTQSCCPPEQFTRPTDNGLKGDAKYDNYRSDLHDAWSLGIFVFELYHFPKRRFSPRTVAGFSRIASWVKRSHVQLMKRLLEKDTTTRLLVLDIDISRDIIKDDDAEQNENESVY